MSTQRCTCGRDALGGVKGSFEMSRCVIIPHADNKTLLSIRMGDVRVVCLDSGEGGGGSRHGEDVTMSNTHPRDVWTTAMLTHPGARMG